MTKEQLRDSIITTVGALKVFAKYYGIKMKLKRSNYDY